MVVDWRIARWCTSRMGHGWHVRIVQHYFLKSLRQGRILFLWPNDSHVAEERR